MQSTQSSFSVEALSPHLTLSDLSADLTIHLWAFTKYYWKVENFPGCSPYKDTSSSTSTAIGTLCYNPMGTLPADIITMRMEQGAREPIPGTSTVPGP